MQSCQNVYGIIDSQFLYYYMYYKKIFKSHISGQSNRIGPVCLCVQICGAYIVHHLNGTGLCCAPSPAMCITNLCCAQLPWPVVWCGVMSWHHSMLSHSGYQSMWTPAYWIEANMAYPCTNIQVCLLCHRAQTHTQIRLILLLWPLGTGM